MNFYTLAKKFEKEFQKEYAFQKKCRGDEVTHDEVMERQLNRFKETCRIGLLLMSEFQTLATSNHSFFCTIRPDCTKITFHDFFTKLCQDVLKRSWVKVIDAVTFEQKGTSLDTLGQGFHTHFIIETSMRSKGELLRALQSAFNKSTAGNCIDVQLTKNKEYIIDNYFEGYVSKDGHKESTCEWDKKWRDREGLKNIYRELPIKSVGSSN